MQYVAAAERVGEAVKDIAAFARANPGQAALNKLTLYQAAKEIRSDFGMVRRYYRKARGRFRAARRRYVRRSKRSYSRISMRPRKRQKTYRKRMHPAARIGKSAKQSSSNRTMDYGSQYVLPWEIGSGNSTLSEPGTRLRSWTNVNGMRLCIRVVAENSLREVEYHWALVQQKTPSAGSPVGDKDSLLTNFFTDNRPGQIDKFTDFDTGTPLTNWSAFLGCGRINSSEYKIIMHKKALLAAEPISAGTVDAGNKGTGHIFYYNKYIKMRKRVLFNAVTDVTGRFPVYFVDWCTMPTSKNYPTVVIAAAQRYVEMTTYYDAF